MPQLIIHKTTGDFINYNEEYLADNYYSHYNFIKVLENRKKSGIKINNAFNILDDDGSNIFCVLHDSINFLIYGEKWNKNVLTEFSNFAHLHNAPSGTSFTGRKNLILDLVSLNDISYNVFKDRIVYQCQAVNDKIQLSNGQLELAATKDVDMIAKMSYLYHLEEYGKNARRTPEYMRGIVENGIAAQVFFKWTYNGNITSIAQLMNAETPYPFIGHFYTPDEFRKKGFGTSLLLSMTEGLLNQGYEHCGLIADLANAPSNIVFKKVGYEVIYETISVDKK